MNRKSILLIVPVENDMTRKREAYPSGALILLGTMLIQRNHRVRVIHMSTEGLSLEKLKAVTAQSAPDIVGITINTFQTRSAKEISRIVKETNPATLIVAGGPHPSALKTAFFDDFPHVDITVVGEGEHTFMDIVEGKDPALIDGICLKGKENPPRRPASDLDYLPLPNLDLVDLKMFSGADPVGGYPSMFIMASRGCPFQCTFCNKSIWGSKVRFRKPELVVREIEWLHTKYGVREIFFQDDTFNLNRAWAETIFKLIIEKGLNKGIVYKTPFRANENLVDEPLLRLAKKAGFWLIFFGVESGNQRMLDSMGKGLKIEEIKRAFRLAHKAGIKTIGSFIMGMPGETKESAADTVRLWEEIHPYVTGAASAMPFPNTEFDRIVTSKGHKLITDYDDYSMSKLMVRTDALEARELKEIYTAFRKRIIRRFFIDLIKLRYWRMLLFIFRSPWYVYHIYYRITAFLRVK